MERTLNYLNSKESTLNKNYTKLVGMYSVRSLVVLSSVIVLSHSQFSMADIISCKGTENEDSKIVFEMSSRKVTNLIFLKFLGQEVRYEDGPQATFSSTNPDIKKKDQVPITKNAASKQKITFGLSQPDSQQGGELFSVILSKTKQDNGLNKMQIKYPEAKQKYDYIGIIQKNGVRNDNDGAEVLTVSMLDCEILKDHQCHCINEDGSPFSGDPFSVPFFGGNSEPTAFFLPIESSDFNLFGEIDTAKVQERANSRCSVRTSGKSNLAKCLGQLESLGR